MTIVSMKVAGYKNITLAELKLDPHMNLITGLNGTGKTSLVESFINGIIGKTDMGKKPQRMIKHGEEKAIIDIELEDGDDTLKIRRTITEKDVYLKAERKDGKPVSQTDLDRLLDSATINITKLLHLGPKEQIDFMKRVAGIDTDAIEAKYKDLYAERTVLNRSLKDAKGAAKSFGDVDKVEFVSLSGLLAEIEKVDTLNRNIRQESAAISQIERAVEVNNEAIEKASATIEHYTEAIAGLKKEISDKKRSNTGLLKDIRSRKKVLQKEEDTSELREQVSNAEATNTEAKNYELYNDSHAKVKTIQKDVDSVNDHMDKAIAERDKIIKDSKLPFKNIEFDKELGIIIEGIPFNDMSSAQKIKIMSRIYIESKPELKVIYIKDGSLLDPETLKQLEEMSELQDYQFLVEIVDEVEGAIIMREGGIFSGGGI